MNIGKCNTCLLLVLVTILAMTHLLSGCSKIYDGKKLFFKEGCGQCHTFKGKGGRMGPDLSAVTNTRSDGWIESYIHDPKKKNPQARMPSFNTLSSSKRKAIIAFLKN
jgi:cbb3-type cytochrome oxidase cytochrome c subunit